MKCGHLGDYAVRYPECEMVLVEDDQWKCPVCGWSFFTKKGEQVSGNSTEITASVYLIAELEEIIATTLEVNCA